MSIFHISAECYPIAKVGGLGDVVGALPKYQNEIGEQSKVIMPFYDNAFTKNHNFKTVYTSKFNLEKRYEFKILTLEQNELGFEIYFVDIQELLFKNFVYSNEDTKRFLAFQIAALDWLVQLKEKPSIVHCHDHHTGLIPFMMSHCYAYISLKQTPSVFTIHNAQYQGWFSHDQLHLIPPFDHSKIGLLDWDYSINPLAAAIKCAWKVTTVSPNYMEELKISANGLEALLQHESAKCVGILNGIDTDVWNPSTDEFLIKNYNIASTTSGKKANKDWVCKEFKLNKKQPLFAFIGRLVGEKGADLLPEIFTTVLKEENLSVIMLGSGDAKTENALQKLVDTHKGQYNAFVGYDEKLSHIIYAAADFILMPSRVEPCGLNQLYALRYGTVPIVNSVGGLKDTVVDIDDNGFGIRHPKLSVKEVVKAINRSLMFYEDFARFKKNRKFMMSIDHSWDVSAQAYVNLYNSLIP